MRLRFPRLRVLVLVAMVVAALAIVGWWAFGPSGVAVELTKRSWRMEIIVERLRSESGSDWCDELPEGAFDISRRTIADPTGKRAEPSEHCRYNVLAWRRSWIVKNEGGPEDRPDWPRPPLRVAPPGQPGSERLSKREAYFEIELRDREDHAWVCRVDPEHWKQLRVGMRFRMPVDRFGTANCPAMYPSNI
ncbi:hypothetical protein [Pelomonas sp. Root1217]|uniref:hypothetical protein n=1 Tax=Pelomonas sp. Root1217 TaxID=1736430 RepID=UPI0012FA918F|nr:hypothetical protein [Pelomonas sp. Root1217]